ncbi:DUF4397 domain-containing protein [Archangium lansingense]|uniref:DUF4397 domain-containing protein n=1 Tax=Archangium lansingense TaxID=2995310 RepID=UPI003B800D78
MTRPVFKGWLLLLGLGLAAVGAGCAEECVDQFDCARKGPAPEGQRYTCRELECELVDVEPPSQQPQGDAGTDAGTDDAGVDAGTDAGTDDAGVDAGTDAGVPPRAYVRFVNAFLGLKNNTSDSADAPWAPYSIDLRVDGSSQKLFAAVKPGAAAVTAYQELPLEASGQSVTFVARNAEGTDTEVPMATSEAMALQDGEHVTVIGLGSLLYVGMDRLDKPKLLVLRDDEFEAVTEADMVRVRYVSADRVTGTNRNRRLTNEAGTALNTVSPYSADVAEGVLLPAATQRVSFQGAPAFQPSQSGRLYVTLPAGTLATGTGYYAITTGDDRRSIQDEGAPALLLLAAGKEQSVRLQRDPLLFFFHALMPATPGTASTTLQVLNASGQVIANNLKYGAAPLGIGDLPAIATSTTVKLTKSGDATATLVPDTATGKLEAGRRYLAVVSGREGESSRLTLVKEDFGVEPALGPLARFIQASPNAPSAVDLGFFTLQEDGTSPATFMPALPGVDYGAISTQAQGVRLEPPVVTPSAGTAYVHYGVRVSSGGSSVERSIKGRAITVPTFFILMGDWTDLTSGTANNVLTYRALNLRVNNWSPTAPFDTSFSPVPPPPPPPAP